MRILTEADVRAVLDPVSAVDAIEDMLRDQAAGKTYLPQRVTTDFTHGWFRVMPGAIVGDRGRPVMGAKVMNFLQGVGLYYLVLLYDEQTGDLIAQMDASTLTRIRTGAVSGVFARRMLPRGVERVGILGSGYEARGQLEVVARCIPIGSVRVYSPTPANREAFAREMGEELGLQIEAVSTPEEAVRGAQLVIGAVKSEVPVAQADWFDPGAVIISIGSTRLNERELEAATFARAHAVVADHREQALVESGDIQAALKDGHLREDQVHELYSVVAGDTELNIPPDRLTVFKTVGTALQDLAVARMVYERCVEQGLGKEIEDFLTRKPVARTVMR